MYRQYQYPAAPPPYFAAHAPGAFTVAGHNPTIAQAQPNHFPSATRGFIVQTTRDAQQAPMVTTSTTQPFHTAVPTLQNATIQPASSVRSLRTSTNPAPQDPTLVTMSSAHAPRTVVVPKIPTASYPTQPTPATIQLVTSSSMPTIVTTPTCFTYAAPIQRDLYPATPRVSVPRQLSHMRIAPPQASHTPRSIQTIAGIPQHAYAYHPQFVAHIAAPNPPAPLMTVIQSQPDKVASEKSILEQQNVSALKNTKPIPPAPAKSLTQQQTQTDESGDNDPDDPFDATTQTDESHDDSEAGLIDDEELVDYEGTDGPSDKEGDRTHELIVEIKADVDDLSWNPLHFTPIVQKKEASDRNDGLQNTQNVATNQTASSTHQHFDSAFSHNPERDGQLGNDYEIQNGHQKLVGEGSIADLLKQAQLHREKELQRRKKDEQSLTELRQWNTGHSLPHNHITNARS